MNKNIELEALRGFASLYIVLHHSITIFFLPNIFTYHIFKFGQEAVIIFFLMSGFVITMSMHKNDYSFREYLLHRFIRIYPIFIISILLSGIIYFSIYPHVAFDLSQLISNIFMLQDKPELKPGTFSSPIFHNEPLWSLSYEWWFYIIFYFHFLFFLKNKHEYNLSLFSALALSLIGILTYKIHYNQVSIFLIYYFLWFSGGYLYLILQQKNSLKKNLIKLGFSYILIIFIYWVLFIMNEQISHYVDHPFLELRHYISAAFFLFLSLIVSKFLFPKIKQYFLYIRIRNFFAFFGPISFALYVFHYPIKNLLNTIELNGWIKLLILFALSILLSYLAEIKFQPIIKKSIMRFFKG